MDNALALAVPPPLDAYTGEAGRSLGALLAGRIAAEPLNLVATILFAAAILHTFAAPSIAARARRLAHPDGASANAAAERSFRVEVLHLLGEIEVVFGLWAVPLLAVIVAMKGWTIAESFIGHGVSFTEPFFVVVIMAIASTRPVMQAAEAMIGLVARLAGGTPIAWWVSILGIAPLLGSVITEPAAMVVAALLLVRRLYVLGPSRRLAYGTLGLLFVDVSIGGTLTHFAAPPVLMVARAWGWNTPFMAHTFGARAVPAILAANLLYAVIFRREFASLARRQPPGTSARTERPPAPPWIVAVHLGFLAWTVATAHTPALFVGGFLFFIAFVEATQPHQEPLNLRAPLLVGFFLAGLVVHGALQAWWIAPVLGRLHELPLFFGAVGLTAFNDNAAITYLASLVPSFSDGMKVAVVAGAIAGGGLTVIANAPNPAGLAILSPYFERGVSAAGLAAAALVPTLIACAALLLP